MNETMRQAMADAAGVDIDTRNEELAAALLDSIRRGEARQRRAHKQAPALTRSEDE